MSNLNYPSQTFWNGRRVFLTGHTGFKGSWLSLWLRGLGAEVSGYALAPPSGPSLFCITELGQQMHSTLGDVTNAPHLAAAMAEARPEIVIHMAAQALVREGYRDPVGTYATNVMGTVHLLDAVRKTPGVRAVVVVTSDKCYENREWLWGYRENEPLGGVDPYSSSKAATELVASAYRASYFPPERHAEHGVALATARAGNVIGGGDWAAERLVPDVLSAFAANRPVILRNPTAIRPWQHVLEPLYGYLTLAERLYDQGSTYSEAWNFGPAEDDARPVDWVVEQLAAHWENGATFTLDDAPQPHEAHYLKLDCSKARARLDWRPRWTLTAALVRVVEWQRAWHAGADMHEICLRQIAAHRDTSAQ